MTGQDFHGWKAVKCIGKGAFGKVYKITREEFGHTYESALKVIDIPQSQSEVKAFKNEGMTDENVTTYFHSMVEKIVEEFVLMSRLKGNSNIVSYEDHIVKEKKNEFGWRIYIRMELLTPLLTYVKDHGLSEQDVIKLGIDICRSLELCKKNHIIHRDIKPENIFISSAGDFKLGDFGIARELEQTSTGLTRVGTKNYMAPELYKGNKYNSTVDIYSLGIVLYRFLNDNRLPFMPLAPQPITYADRELAFNMRFSGQTMPDPSQASSELSKIILKACAYLPEDRYALARDMRVDLEKLKNEEIVIEPYNHMDGQDVGDRTIKLFNSDSQVSKVQKADGECENDEKQEIGIDDKLVEIQDKKNRSKYIVIIVFCTVIIGSSILILNRNNKNSDGMGETMARATPIPILEKVLVSETIGSIVPITLISVPEVKNLTKQELEKKLSEYNMSAEYGDEEYSDSVKKGHVISQNPEAGVSTEMRSNIVVVLSKGVEKVIVPQVEKMSLEQAKSSLKKKGLKYTVDEKYSALVHKGYVVSQSIKAKTKVKKGKNVVIVVSKGKKPVQETKKPSYSDNKPSTTKTPQHEKSDGTFTDDENEKSDGTFQ